MTEINIGRETFLAAFTTGAGGEAGIGWKDIVQQFFSLQHDGQL